MQTFLKVLALTIAAVLFSIPLTIAVDLALYDALDEHLGDRQMKTAIDYIDKTETSRTVGFILLLMLWSGVVLGINQTVNYFGPKKQIATTR